MRYKITLCILISLLPITAKMNACCPDGRPKGLMGGHMNGDCDPAFLFADAMPLQNLADRTTELWEIVHLPSRQRVFSKKEKADWQEISVQMQVDAYAAAMNVWIKNNYSKEFKRMTLTKAMALVRETGQMENLKFMMLSLNDYQIQKQKCLTLAKGNSLERKLAVHQLNLLESNPQLRQN